MDWGIVASGVSAIGDWFSDTFFGGSKSTKLSAKNAELASTIEQQNALLSSYQGTVQQLLSEGSSKKTIMYVGLGGAVLGAVYLMTRKKGRVF